MNPIKMHDRGGTMKSFKTVVWVLMVLFIISSAVFAATIDQVEKEKGVEKRGVLAEQKKCVKIADLEGLEELKGLEEKLGKLECLKELEVLEDLKELEDLHIDLSALRSLEQLKNLDIKIEGLEIFKDIDFKEIVTEAIASVKKK